MAMFLQFPTAAEVAATQQTCRRVARAMAAAPDEWRSCKPIPVHRPDLEPAGYTVMQRRTHVLVFDELNGDVTTCDMTIAVRLIMRDWVQQISAHQRKHHTPAVVIDASELRTKLRGGA